MASKDMLKNKHLFFPVLVIDSSGLPIGAKVGIGIAVLLVIGLIICFYYRRRTGSWQACITCECFKKLDSVIASEKS